MEEILLGDILRATGSDSQLPEMCFNKICTDTRAIEPGCLFIALRGNTFDGNDFVKAAIESGAAAAVTERPIEGLPCIAVKSGNQALLDIASAYRQKFNIPVCAVTGSVGKTTVKEMTALAFGAKYNTLKTEGNLNNEIGMPKTLFGLDRNTGAAVIEMGMNHFGEIERMSRSCRPTMAIINNIGSSHIENLGSREGILKAKLEVLAGMENNAPLIVNRDNDMLCDVDCRLGRGVIGFGIDSDCDFRAENIAVMSEGTEFDIAYGGQREHITLPCIGRHNVYNALAAFSAGVTIGIDPAGIARKLSEYTPVGMRQRIRRALGQTVIIDCYNASPDSMNAAIDVLMQTKPEKGGRRAAVLADMLELGERAPELHSAVGKYAAEEGVDLLICYGHNAAYIAKGAEVAGLHAGCTTDKSMLCDYLKAVLREGDTVLFKGSRGMKLEETIAEIYGKEILG